VCKPNSPWAQEALVHPPGTYMTYFVLFLGPLPASVYFVSSKEDTCYIWNELKVGCRACEIRTCLIMHLRLLPPSIKNIYTRQYRNSLIASALLYAMNRMPNIEINEQKCFEPGHTQMGCYLMHATTDHAKKTTSIFTQVCGN